MKKNHIFSIPEDYKYKKENLLRLDEINQKPTLSLLVIDDEERIRDAYSRLFWHYGFNVLTASNAKEANDLLVHNKFDIVFLDIKLAEVDGSVLFGIIRKFHKEIKIVVSSVYSIDEQKERIKDADAYFDKSDGMNVLLRIISFLSGGSSPV